MHPHLLQHQSQHTLNLPSFRMYTLAFALASFLLLTVLSAITIDASIIDSQQKLYHTLEHDYPASSLKFPSSGLSHSEPVLNYKLRHIDNAYIHAHHIAGTLSYEDHTMHTQNTAKSLAAHSLRQREYEGLIQPYPDEISISFHIYGKLYEFNHMQLMTSLFVPHSKTKIMIEGQSEPLILPNTLSSYTYSSQDRSVDATITMHSDGLFQGLITEYDQDGVMIDTIEIVPLVQHAQFYQSHSSHQESYSQLEQEAEHGLVAFKHSHLEVKKGSHQCGSMEEVVDEEGKKKVKLTTEEMRKLGRDDVSITNASSSTQSSSSRRLLLAPGVGVTRWTNCYPGDTTAHKISVGVAADISYYEIYNSITAAQAAISAIYANVNAVYKAQFNVFLQVDQMLIQSTTGGPAWNTKPATKGAHCATAITDMLNVFSSWRQQTTPKTESIWHMLTNCYPPAGIVGIAWIGVICNSAHGTGISSYTQTHWLVVAHETGHNFGGNHAFQLGQGKTGGIMDYGDSTYPLGSGIYQFHPTYNEAEMCAEMTKDFKLTGITPFCSAIYSSSCGNGVIESGEDCDDTSACCVNCKFKSGGVCSAGSNAENTCCDSTCQFRPTTLACGALSSSGKPSGYCSNGACVQSVCSGYSDLTYCGTLSTNPCRQTCLYQGKCTDGFTTPNVKIPDGAVCSTTPYSTCRSGQCVSSTSTGSTYKWVTSNPSTCSCGGTQTLTVKCVDSAGNQAPSTSSCAGQQQPSSTQTCTPPATCAKWTTSTYDVCSNDCGSGLQTRSVTCTSSSTSMPVDSSLCAGQTKPVSSQACPNLPACPVVWQASGFSACTVSCGGGVQTQTVTCMQTQNGVQSAVTSTACIASTKPATQQSCNTQACQNGIQWTYGVWGDCSQKCGGGNQTRAATCTQNQNSVATSFCSSLPSPLTTQPCNTSPCPNYQWHAAQTWTQCSLACGAGTQTRMVQCYDTASDLHFMQPVSPDMCVGAKPLSLQSCNTQACTPNQRLAWRTFAWSPCSRDCRAGGGISTRQVWCIDASNPNVALPDSTCTSQTGSIAKPVTMQTCGRTGCPSFRYMTSDWSGCSVACSSGYQVRRVACVDERSYAVVRNTFCNGTAPVSMQACNTAACALSVTNTWSTGEWSNCSAECNGGFRTRLVQCLDKDGITQVSDSLCKSLPQPLAQSPCNSQSCGTYWYTSDWSVCSSACGIAGGLQTRTVSCLRATDDPLTATPLAATACSGTKPSTESICNANPCPIYVVASDWSDCNAKCGAGLSSRNVSCQDYTGAMVDQSFCAGSAMPIMSKVCQLQACPHWHRGAWGLCSQLCGGGSQNRTLICRMPHDNITFGVQQSDETLCPPPGQGDVGDGVGLPGVAVGQPASIQPCNIAACPRNYWKLGSWSTCSSSCDGGVATTDSVTCVSSTTGQRVDESLCLDTKPSLEKACNVGLPCPVYQWQAEGWQECSVYCGAGVQQRLVRCFNTNPSVDMLLPRILVNDSLCDMASKPDTQQACQVRSTDVCFGIAYADGTSGGLKNGRCDSNTGQCVCRSGMFGPTCDSYASITQVQTNSAQFIDGVPIDEVLSITWNTSSMTNVPFVSVLLLKHFSSLLPNQTQLGSEWATGSYLAVRIVNAGIFTWTVGSILNGLEFGNGYTIRILGSKNLYADSAPFTLADPCAYKTCGLHGRCMNGACTCTTGFTGTMCEVGPCERANCRMESSTCNNSLVITTPVPTLQNALVGPSSSPLTVCECTFGYSGSQCRTPAACAGTISCQNGGDYDSLTGMTMSNTCQGQCKCINSWSGMSCEQCALSCQNGGTQNSDCSSCQCSAGYTGKQCQCRYYLLDMTFDLDNNADAAGWQDESTQIERFKETLSQDISSATMDASKITPNVTVEQLTFTSNNQVTAKIRFALPCQDIAADEIDSGQAVQQHGQQGIVTTTPTNGEASLLAVYTSLLPQFISLDSTLYSGLITSKLSSSSPVVARDPTGTDSLPQPQMARDCFQVQCDFASGGGLYPTDSESSSSNPAMKPWLIVVIILCGTLTFGLLIALSLYVHGKCAAIQRRRNIALEKVTRAQHELSPPMNAGIQGTASSAKPDNKI